MSPPFSLNLPQLAYCVVQFLEKESSLTEPVTTPRAQVPSLLVISPCQWVPFEQLQKQVPRRDVTQQVTWFPL